MRDIPAAGAKVERPGDHAVRRRKIVAIRRGDVSRGVGWPGARAIYWPTWPLWQTPGAYAHEGLGGQGTGTVHMPPAKRAANTVPSCLCDAFSGSCKAVIHEALGGPVPEI